MGGSASVNGEALSKFAEENHTLYVDLFVLPLDISNLKYTIRPGYRLDEMDAMAEYATKVLGAKTVGILCQGFCKRTAGMARSGKKYGGSRGQNSL